MKWDFTMIIIIDPIVDFFYLTMLTFDLKFINFVCLCRLLDSKNIFKFRFSYSLNLFVVNLAKLWWKNKRFVEKFKAKDKLILSPLICLNVFSQINQSPQWWYFCYKKPFLNFEYLIKLLSVITKHCLFTISIF